MNDKQHRHLVSITESPLAQKKGGALFLAILLISTTFNIIFPMLALNSLSHSQLSEVLSWAESVDLFRQRVLYLRTRSELSAVAYIVGIFSASLFGIFLGLAQSLIFKKYVINSGHHTKLNRAAAMRALAATAFFGLILYYYLFSGTPAPGDRDTLNQFLLWPWFSMLVFGLAMYLGGVIFLIIGTCLKFLAGDRRDG